MLSICFLIVTMFISISFRFCLIYITNMSITKNICANIISLFGIFILILLICYMLLTLLVYPDYILDGFTFKLLVLCCNLYIFVIPSLIILGTIEYFFADKISFKKYFLNFQIKSKYLKYTYNILFWLGIVSSVLYLFVYVWVISR